MSQPKYFVRCIGHGFQYWNGKESTGASSVYDEEDLELYVEPEKPKKLYAYKYKDQVFFAVNDAKWLRVTGAEYEAHRASEFDISYPDSLV